MHSKLEFDRRTRTAWRRLTLVVVNSALAVDAE